MANLRRIPYTKPIPTDAQLFTRKGARFARFKNKKGKTVEARVTEDGTRVRLESRKWYGEYKDADGIERCVPLSTDRTAAEQLLAERVRQAERVQANLATPAELEGAGRTLAEHLAGYRRALEAKGNCPEHIQKTCARIKAVLDGCRFTFFRDVDADAVAEFLHALRRDPPRPALPPGRDWFTPGELALALGGTRPAKLARVLRREGLEARGTGKARRYPLATVEALQARFCRGIGASTSNGYLTALKGFTRWLSRKQKAGPDPLGGADLVNAAADVRHEHRALPEGELRAVLAAAAASAVGFEGLAGPDRHMLYAVAMVTGFRASELASLAPRSFALDADPPTATVRAAYTKNGRKAVQPLPPDVAAALRGYLAGRPATAPLWPGGWPDEGAEMLRLDLAAAGIPYRDAEGRVADFHALRHSYITLLERSGVSPKLAQELARHSDIRLTMNVYTHARLCDLAGAIESLPALLHAGPEGKARALPATGTDGAAGRESLRPACAKGEAGSDSVRAAETGTARGPLAGEGPQTLALQAFESGRGQLRLSEGELPGQDSNLDKENQNPKVRRRVAAAPFLSATTCGKHPAAVTPRSYPVRTNRRRLRFTGAKRRDGALTGRKSRG